MPFERTKLCEFPCLQTSLGRSKRVQNGKMPRPCKKSAGRYNALGANEVMRISLLADKLSPFKKSAEREECPGRSKGAGRYNAL